MPLPLNCAVALLFVVMLSAAKHLTLDPRHRTIRFFAEFQTPPTRL
jgi:hypothetical protein